MQQNHLESVKGRSRRLRERGLRKFAWQIIPTLPLLKAPESHVSRAKVEQNKIKTRDSFLS